MMFVRSGVGFFLAFVSASFMMGLVLTAYPANSDKFDLRGIPGPFNFHRFQRLGDRDFAITVGGGGYFNIEAKSAEKDYRGWVSDLDLNGLYFITPERGWVIGTNGGIYWTKDQGRTWTSQESSVKSELIAISCIGDSQCWVVGDDGIIVTTNDGRTWKRLNSGVRARLNAVDFLDRRNGVVVGDKGLIIRTSDGGRSWKKEVITGGEETCKGHSFWDSPENLHAITIFDASTAWVGAISGIGRYSVLNRNWEWQCNNDVSGIVGIVTHDGKTVFLVGSDGNNLISNNSGITWNHLIQRKKHSNYDH